MYACRVSAAEFPEAQWRRRTRPARAWPGSMAQALVHVPVVTMSPAFKSGAPGQARNSRTKCKSDSNGPPSTTAPFPSSINSELRYRWTCAVASRSFSAVPLSAIDRTGVRRPTTCRACSPPSAMASVVAGVQLELCDCTSSKLGASHSTQANISSSEALARRCRRNTKCDLRLETRHGCSAKVDDTMVLAVQIVWCPRSFPRLAL